jgi:hypothetical protein
MSNDGLIQPKSWFNFVTSQYDSGPTDNHWDYIPQDADSQKAFTVCRLAGKSPMEALRMVLEEVKREDSNE